ncbi:hypothetical protein ACHAXR_003531 [Thalassiosira sp. AJA248-18]
MPKKPFVYPRAFRRQGPYSSSIEEYDSGPGGPDSVGKSTALSVNIKVEVGEGEPIESALRRFKREVNKSGHLMDLRYKRYFENSQDRKKRKIVQARFRKRMERMNAKRMRQQRT